MKILQLKDISVKTSNRDCGSQAAIRLFEILLSAEMNEADYLIVKGLDAASEASIMPYNDDIYIDIPIESDVSTSFLDEIIYRLAEQNQLHRFRFQIRGNRVHEKLILISTNRNVQIKVNWDGKDQTIEPSAKTPTKLKIDYQDL